MKNIIYNYILFYKKLKKKYLFKNLQLPLFDKTS
jgi:hypothetical protein